MKKIVATIATFLLFLLSGVNGATLVRIENPRFEDLSTGLADPDLFHFVHVHLRAEHVLRRRLAFIVPMALDMLGTLLPIFPSFLRLPANEDDNFFLFLGSFIHHDGNIDQPFPFVEHPFLAKPFDDFIGVSLLDDNRSRLNKHRLISSLFHVLFRLPTQPLADRINGYILR